MAKVSSKEEYNAYMKQYMDERYYRRQRYCIEKLGGKCVRCGSVERLEFDHVDPNNKSFSIGSKLAGVSQSKLDEELDKCQLLCYDCHKVKHESQHGMIRKYQKGCRCPLCVDAMRSYNKSYKRKRARSQVVEGSRLLPEKSSVQI